MIAWLKGNIVEIDDTEVILNTNGVGYRVLVGKNVQQVMGLAVGEEKEIIIYTAVKEDEIRLFGFDSFFSRKVFVLLLSVNGVGPKVALNILDQLSSTKIIIAIKNNDYHPFLKVSGVGKKTAQRIILDLQNKVQNKDAFVNVFESTNSIDKNEENQLSAYSDIGADVKSALVNLGFSEKEVNKVVEKNLKPGIELNEIIKICLVELRQIN